MGWLWDATGDRGRKRHQDSGDTKMESKRADTSAHGTQASRGRLIFAYDPLPGYQSRFRLSQCNKCLLRC